MSAEIINPERYKKTTRREIEKRKKNNKQKNSTKLKNKNSLKYIKAKNKKQKIKNKTKIKTDNEFKFRQNLDESSLKVSSAKTNKKKKKARYTTIYIPTSLKVCGAVFAIFVIGVISKGIVKIENMPIISVFSNKDKTQELQKDYDLKLGISKLDTTDVSTSKNIVLNELNLFANARLLEINKDYTFNFLGAEKIEKISEKEYLVYLNDEYGLKFEDVKNTVDSIKSKGEENIYYKNVSSIEKVEEIEKDKIFKISLNVSDPYFMYKLDFPIELQDKNKKGNQNIKFKEESKTENYITIKNEAKDSTISKISLTNYQDSDDMVADFREDKIDMFFASSDLLMQLIGKHEYNVKKYRDGENIFLLGNKDSNLFSLKEVRKALAYSLKREDIIKEVNNSFAEVIDLPFIYSETKYKYDIYGAENELLSNGWKKKNGVYAKEVNGENLNLELNLIVKETDETKKKIATSLKDMAQNIGIKINVNILNEKDFNENLQNKNYDIVLADIFVNQYPDVDYLKEYININEETNLAFSKVYESTTSEELAQNINLLEETLSSEVACIRNPCTKFKFSVSKIYFRI